MNLNLTINQAKQFADEKYNILPLSREIFSDIKTPVEVMRILMEVSEHCFILESAGDNENWGRYTFLGFNPKLSVTCKDGHIKISHMPENTDEVFETDNPDFYIRRILAENRSPVLENMPPFTGGLVGYFAYDYLKYSEPVLKSNVPDREKFNDVDLMLFDKVIAFDNFRQKIILIVNISLNNNLQDEYNYAEKELNKIEALIKSGRSQKDFSCKLKSDFRKLFSKEDYCSMVKKAQEHIIDGDIFQIVLSNRMEADFDGSLFNTYRVLRTLNPSPYMFYFSGTDIETAGASPETLVKLHNGVLHTFPLAGTRKRGQTPEDDKNLENELLNDPKELAEHDMLVDLGRNDLGRVCKFGTVEVEKYHEILRFSHVMHIGSTVRGVIRDDLDQLDAVNAILPAGTLSGAPKIKACQLISEIEQDKRGIYGGAVGYIDFTGNLDLCIAIRIAYKKNNKVFVRSGAGIVADSVPENEYQECLNKAGAVVEALKAAEGI